LTVNRVTIHHEGGGSPSDNVGRFSEGGYCCGIGVTMWEHWRWPEDNWATLNFNGQDVTICLSGNRMDHDVTPNDINLIHQAFQFYYDNGKVIAVPEVVAHRNSPGSATACPGDRTMNVWNDVVNACRAGAAPGPEPKPPEEEDFVDLASAINHDGRPVVVQVGGDKRLYYRIRAATGGDWGDWKDLSGGMKDFATVTAFSNPAPMDTIEVFVTMENGRTFHRWQTGADKAGWSGWADVTL